MSNTQNKSINTKIIGAFILGVLIPLLAAVMPWLVERAFPQSSLTYSFKGPISGDDFAAVELLIENNGRKSEENIEAYIPIKVYSHKDVVTAKDGTVKIIEKNPEILMESSIPSTSSTISDDNLLVKIDSIKPSEKVVIKVVVRASSVLMFDHDVENARIISKDVKAQYSGQSETELYVYKVGTWLFVLFLIFIVLYGAYYEYLMPRDQKEKYLLEQIDKLK